jgi:hypothetical protein
MLCALLCFAWTLGACSTFSTLPEEASSGVHRVEGGMTQAELELAFGDLVDAIEGPPGSIRSQVAGVNVYLISEPAKDRMRLIVPVAGIKTLDARYLGTLLEANFESTLEARYAISDGAVHAIFIHSLSSLTQPEVESALRQVLNLKKNFGTSFSGGETIFNTPSGKPR